MWARNRQTMALWIVGMTWTKIPLLTAFRNLAASISPILCNCHVLIVMTENNQDCLEKGMWTAKERHKVSGVNIPAPCMSQSTQALMPLSCTLGFHVSSQRHCVS